jgi:hypothetical protein
VSVTLLLRFTFRLSSATCVHSHRRVKRRLGNGARMTYTPSRMAHALDLFVLLLLPR